MKKIFTLLLIAVGIVAHAQTSSTELVNYITFANLKNEVKADFGTLENPLPSGAFMDINNPAGMQAQMRKLKSSYRWPDGATLDFSKRGSKQGKTGIVDVYTIANGKDTIRLHVDPYHKADTYFVPKGLVALNGSILAKELAPLIKMAEEFYTAKDAYALKESTLQLVVAIQKQIGTDIFVDADALTPVINDKEVDKDLGGYLVKTYLISKFLAHAKNIKDPKGYATTKMKENFSKFSEQYPEVKAGSLKETLK